MPDGKTRNLLPVSGIILMLTVAILCLFVLGASPRVYNQQCPKLSVSCPDSVSEGDSITFTATTDTDVAGLHYNWSVDAGVISSGQGTPSIVVRDVPGNVTVTATVHTDGCTNEEECKTFVSARSAFRAVDAFEPSAFDDEKARLDNFVIELQGDPTSQAYLICYGGRKSRKGEAQKECERAKGYMVNTRGIDPDRIVTVNGGYKETKWVELWIVPLGAAQPQSSPTVDPAEVQIIKTPARSHRGRALRRRGKPGGH
jgi:hypothetical protein